MALPAVRFGESDPPRATRSSDAAYAAAAIELYARLWGALERVGTAERYDEADARLLAVRVELHLLREALESNRWRMMLSTPQRTGLMTVIRRMLREVGFATDPEPARLMREQNLLLEAVIALCRRNGLVVAYARAACAAGTYE